MTFSIILTVPGRYTTRLFFNNVLETVGKKGSIHNFGYFPLYTWRDKENTRTPGSIGDL
jgi:hypothetical protein